MKKVFKSMIVVLSFLSMGMLTTSCEEGGILSQILPNLFGQTETYNYSGTATSECLTGAASTMQWNYINTPTSIKLTAPCDADGQELANYVGVAFLYRRQGDYEQCYALQSGHGR